MHKCDRRVLNYKQFIPSFMLIKVGFDFFPFYCTVSSRSWSSTPIKLLSFIQPESLWKSHSICCWGCGPVPFAWVPQAMFMTTPLCLQLTDGGRSKLKAIKIQVSQWPTRWTQALSVREGASGKLIRYPVWGALRVTCKHLTVSYGGRNWKRTVNKS